MPSKETSASRGAHKLPAPPGWRRNPGRASLGVPGTPAREPWCKHACTEGFLASRRRGHCSRLRFLGRNTAKDMVGAGSKTERPREAWLPPPQPRGLSQSQLCLQMPLRTVPGTQASRVMPYQGQSLDTTVARIWGKSARPAQEKCRGTAGSSAPLPRLWGSVRRVAGGHGHLYCCQVHAPHPVGPLTHTTFGEDAGHGLHRHQQPHGCTEALRGRCTHMG